MLRSYRSSHVPNHQNHPQFALDWIGVEICQTSGDSGRHDPSGGDSTLSRYMRTPSESLTGLAPYIYCIRGHRAIVVHVVRTPSDYLEQSSVHEISQCWHTVYTPCTKQRYIELVPIIVQQFRIRCPGSFHVIVILYEAYTHIFACRLL